MATHAYTAASSATTGGDLHVPLMPMHMEENPCPRRGHHGLFKVVAVSVLLALGIGFGVFFGGFYLGKAQTHSCDASATTGASTSASTSTTPTTPLSAAVMVSLGGRSVTLSAINGNGPASSFLQCVMVPTTTNPSGVACQPANSLLTYPGSVILTLYEFQSEYSLIVTATGSKYGMPKAAGSTNNVEANFTVHISGLNGAHISAPHLLPGSVVLANGMATTNVIVREYDSLNTIFSQLRMTPSFLMSNYLTGNTGDLAMYVMGANLQPVFLGDSLPTKTNPVTIGWAGMQAQSPVPAALEEATITYTPVYTTSSFQISQGQTNGRRRRGFWGSLLHTVAGDAVNYGMNYLLTMLNGDGEATHHVHVSYDRLGSLGLTFNITQLESDAADAANVILSLSGNNAINGLDASNLITAATSVYSQVAGDLSGLQQRRGVWTTLENYGLSLLQSNGVVPPLTTNNAVSSVPSWALNVLSNAGNYLQQAENALSGNRRSSCGSSLWNTLTSAFTCGKGIYQRSTLQSDFTNCGSAVQNGYSYYQNCASQGTWWRRSVEGEQ